MKVKDHFRLHYFDLSSYLVCFHLLSSFDLLSYFHHLHILVYLDSLIYLYNLVYLNSLIYLYILIHLDLDVSSFSSPFILICLYFGFARQETLSAEWAMLPIEKKIPSKLEALREIECLQWSAMVVVGLFLRSCGFVPKYFQRCLMSLDGDVYQCV